MAYGDQTVIVIVATEGAVDDWAAYQFGPVGPDTSAAKLIDHAARSGDKIDSALAARLFEDWGRRLSWRG